MRVNLSFTPDLHLHPRRLPAVRRLKGPSCFTAPLVPTRPELPDVLLPQNYQPPKDLAPPPGTVLGPNGNLVAVGPPLPQPEPEPGRSESATAAGDVARRRRCRGRPTPP